MSKNARTDTAISNAGISLTQAGLGLARQEMGGSTGLRALVLGTGVTGRLAARLLRDAGVASLTLAGRTAQAAADLAAAVDATPAGLQDLPRCPPDQTFWSLRSAPLPPSCSLNTSRARGL